MAVREYTNLSFSSFTNAREDGPCIFQQRARARVRGSKLFSLSDRRFFLFHSLFSPPSPPLSFAPHVRSIFYLRKQKEKEREGMRFPRSLVSLSLPRFEPTYRRPRLFSHAFHVMFFLSFRRLKLDCEKLANDKIEIQRHYVMVSAIIAAS